MCSSNSSRRRPWCSLWRRSNKAAHSADLFLGGQLYKGIGTTAGCHQLMADYFVKRPVFGETFFRWRFLMTKCMYLDICHAMSEKNAYFKRKCNAAGLPGLPPCKRWYLSSLATLIGLILSPQSNKHKYFVAKQAEYRKDVERAFGVLRAKYSIIKSPARVWNIVDLKYIVDCVIILHNMGIMYEQGMEELRIEDYIDAMVSRLDANRNVPAMGRLIARHHQIQSR